MNSFKCFSTDQRKLLSRLKSTILRPAGILALTAILSGVTASSAFALNCENSNIDIVKAYLQSDLVFSGAIMREGDQTLVEVSSIYKGAKHVMPEQSRIELVSAAKNQPLMASADQSLIVYARTTTPEGGDTRAVVHPCGPTHLTPDSQIKFFENGRTTGHDLVVVGVVEKIIQKKKQTYQNQSNLRILSDIGFRIDRVVHQSQSTNYGTQEQIEARLIGCEDVIRIGNRYLAYFKMDESSGLHTLNCTPINPTFMDEEVILKELSLRESGES